MKKLFKKIRNLLPGTKTSELAQDDAQKPNDSKRELIRHVSHEIQGSFFGVAGTCVLLKHAIEKKQDTGILLDHLMNACNSYKYKLNNLLEYIRLDAGLRDTIYEPIDIRTLTGRIVSENQNMASERDIKIALSILDDTPEQIIGDESRISQICTNLLTNAITFTRPGSAVLMQVGKEGTDKWTLLVEDEGEGMTDEELDKVFDPFTTQENRMDNPEGLGLELFITRYLVKEVLKGKITVSSQPAIGTRFTVVLPSQ